MTTENLPLPLPHRRDAIHEIRRGRDLTCQLKLLLDTKSSSSSSSAAQDLVSKIFISFTHTLSILNNTNSSNNAVELREEEVSLSQHHSRDAPKSEISSLDSTSNTSSSTNDRRGSYKRRKVWSDTWVKETERVADDGHGWRKYGQKRILKSEFPRHYYRCTHKYDHNCQATKQVQMIQSTPTPIYRTTYNARHTCNPKTNHLPNFLLLDSSSSNNNDDNDNTDTFQLISFNKGHHLDSRNSIMGLGGSPFLASFAASSSSSSALPPPKHEQYCQTQTLGGGQAQAAVDDVDVEEEEDDYLVSSPPYPADCIQEESSSLAAADASTQGQGEYTSFTRMLMMEPPIQHHDFGAYFDFKP